MKWEVGKVYTTGGNNEWLLLGEGKDQVFVRLVRCRENTRHILGVEKLYSKSFLWREVKPKMKVERWIHVMNNGTTWSLSYKDKNIANLFAIKHLVLEVEKGEGLD